MSTGLIRRSTIVEICNHRNAALAKMGEAVEKLAQGFGMANEASEIGRLAHELTDFYLKDHGKDEHYRDLFRKLDAPAALEAYRRSLDARTWTHVFKMTGMGDLMDRTAREKFDAELSDTVPPFTEDAARQVFGALTDDAKLIFQRGLARTFSDLDRRFKSHDGFKLGSRIILTNTFDSWGSFNHHSRMRETMGDVERVFAVLDGKRPNPGVLAYKVQEDRKGGFKPRQSVTETEYFRVRCFQNGNAHLWLLRDDLVDKANLTLAEYYGEVLPDAAQRGESPSDLRSKSGLPAKDLSFYPTPDAVVERALRQLPDVRGLRGLEPSAGEGGMVRHLLAAGATVDAVEVHPDRFAILQRIRHHRLSILPANFLTLPPRAVYDFVLMNPPFYGTHWTEHVVHAWDFLKPRGTLVAVLPVTAETGESKKHETFREWVQTVTEAHRRYGGNPFTDLPPESFASSGTRINTVLLTMVKP